MFDAEIIRLIICFAFSIKFLQYSASINVFESDNKNKSPQRKTQKSSLWEWYEHEHENDVHLSRTIVGVMVEFGTL